MKFAAATTLPCGCVRMEACSASRDWLPILVGRAELAMVLLAASHYNSGPAMKPPRGVAVIATIQGIVAADLIVKSVDVLVEVSKGRHVESALIVGAIFQGISALISIALAIGLYALRPWARYLTLILYTLALLFVLLAVIRFRPNASTFIEILPIFGLYAWIVWYLFRAALSKISTSWRFNNPNIPLPPLVPLCWSSESARWSIPRRPGSS
jgi:hypothetical protein